MGLIAPIHAKYVHGRRVKTLAKHLAALIPQQASVLDVGSGDGKLARLLLDIRPDLQLQGVDIMVRPQTQIPVIAYDGTHLPLEDHSVDVVTIIDVLHHTDDPLITMREALRVAKQAVLIKDHTCSGLFGRPILEFMDWVGNARHGVAIPGNYWTLQQWNDVFVQLGTSTTSWKTDLGLYPWWANWLFGYGLHFITSLTPVTGSTGIDSPSATRSGVLASK